MPAPQNVSVWTSNRGTVMMVKVALAQAGLAPIFASNAREFTAATTSNDCGCAIAALDDITMAGMTPATLAGGLGAGVRLVLLAAGQTAPDTGSRDIKIVRIPFSAAELRQAIESGSRPAQVAPQRQQQPADITELVRAEVDRIVREKAESMVADAVMKIVPELAEVMIGAELRRLMAEEGEKAVSDDPAPDDESSAG